MIGVPSSRPRTAFDKFFVSNFVGELVYDHSNITAKNKTIDNISSKRDVKKASKKVL